jgi:hypothetical protein
MARMPNFGFARVFPDIDEHDAGPAFVFSDRDSMTGIIILHGMQALAPMSTMVTMPLMGTSWGSPEMSGEGAARAWEGGQEKEGEEKAKIFMETSGKGVLIGWFEELP